MFVCLFFFAELRDELRETRAALDELGVRLGHEKDALAQQLRDMTRRAGDAEAEATLLRARLTQAEGAASETQSSGTEWRHRAERAEHECQLAQKERDRAREEVRTVRERVASAEAVASERMADTA